MTQEFGVERSVSFKNDNSILSLLEQWLIYFYKCTHTYYETERERKKMWCDYKK